MIEKVTIIECRPNERLMSKFNKPETDEEKRNFKRLQDSGAVKILTELRDKHTLYQRKNISGFDDKNHMVIQYEPAVVNIGKDFRSVGILFDGANDTRYEDGSFIRLDLSKSEDQMSLSYEIGDTDRISKTINITDLKDEMFKVLITRETSLDFVPRKINPKQ